MKTPLLLLLLAFASCVHQEQKFYASDGAEIRDCLSDISMKVAAIPLETNGQCRIEGVRQVKSAGTDIFVWSKNDIYRFDRKGVFRNRITVGEGRFIRDYALSVSDQQLLVLDSLQQLHYYTYEGEEVGRKNLFADDPRRTILRIACYGAALWVATENLTEGNYFEKRLCKYDLSGHIMEDYPLVTADLGRFHIEGNRAPELLVCDGKMYAYSPFSPKNTVLRDSLYLLVGDRLYPDKRPVSEVCMLPVRVNRRFLIASYQDNVSEKENYLFLYDLSKNKSYHPDGLKDDFYQTGLVKDLQPLDISGDEYYYYRSSGNVARAFPERGEEDNPVLFIFRLDT
jgi:hypothetical protein